MQADMVWEGVSGHFDALSDLPSNPTKRFSKFYLEVKVSPCVGSTPALNAASYRRIRCASAEGVSRRRRFLMFVRRKLEKALRQFCNVFEEPYKIY